MSILCPTYNKKLKISGIEKKCVPNKNFFKASLAADEWKHSIRKNEKALRSYLKKMKKSSNEEMGRGVAIPFHLLNKSYKMYISFSKWWNFKRKENEKMTTILLK